MCVAAVVLPDISNSLPKLKKKKIKFSLKI